MANLKCIGGPCDGQTQFVDDHYKNGDLIRVRLPMRFEISDFAKDVQDWRHGRIPDYMVEQFAHYKLMPMHFSKDDSVNFLVPHDWTLKQAILHQFGK